MSDAAALPLSGATGGARQRRLSQFVYPERREARAGVLERFARARAGDLAGMTAPLASAVRLARLSRIVRPVAEEGVQLADMSDAALRARAAGLRVTLRSTAEPELPAVAAAFALVRETARRRIGLRHHDVQLIGGYALLQGLLAEMATGEGKTLVASLAAATAALAGRAVHVVTVNDYLARRDAAYCAPIYEALGLSVGLVAEGQTPRQRREAYAADIVYCTNKDLAFDYLRDRMALGRHDGNLRLKVERLARRNDRTDGLLLRGLDFAIVDEADSVLVDEARTPLILSAERESAVDAETADTALSFAREMQPGRDFRLRLDERRVELLEAGRDRIEAMSASLGGPWANPAYREELLVQGLTALNLFQRDQHYIVRDGRIQIVDEYTGRILADRHWSEGLHQIVERKEGCEISGRRVTIARMTYQRLFARYRRLAGMTGTAREAAGEFWQVYRLGVVRIPTHRPPQRRVAPDRVFRTAEAKWTAIVTRVRELHAAGRPVLLGTRSVAASEEAGARLAAAGLPHVILNARHDEDEADIVAEAGHRGRITVATNMAGRGTDIALGEGVPALGGLHVIMSERHDSSRIDRQLAGRCARQGEPGAFEAYLSLEDPLMEMDRGGGVRTFARLAAPLLGERAGRIAFAVTQRRIEAMHSRMRRDLLRADRAQGDALAFSGRQE